jgi:hypothetical protein
MMAPGDRPAVRVLLKASLQLARPHALASRALHFISSTLLRSEERRQALCRSPEKFVMRLFAEPAAYPHDSPSSVLSREGLGQSFILPSRGASLMQIWEAT